LGVAVVDSINCRDCGLRGFRVGSAPLRRRVTGSRKLEEED
jgi:hypothetical protein